MAVNRIKNQSGSAEPEKPVTTAGKKASKAKALRFEQYKSIFGLLLMGTSIFMGLAFTSFLFTWKEDLSFADSAMNLGEIQNWMGYLGFLVAKKFIFDWFGVASFIFLPFIFLQGYKYGFKPKKLLLFKPFLIGLFLLVYFSLTFSFFFNDSIKILGGVFGQEVEHDWLGTMIGSTGVGILLGITGLSFLILMFNLTLKVPTFSVKKVKTEEGAESPKIDDKSASFVGKIKDSLKDVNEEEEENYIEPEPIVLPKIPKENKAVTPNEGVGFEIKKKVIEAANASNEAKQEEDINRGSWYKYPSLTLLKDHGNVVPEIDTKELEERKNLIVQTLENYKIKIDKIQATVGPTVTLYEIIPSAGIRISKIKSLEDDIALSLAALGIRIIAPMPGKGTIGIEVPNLHPEMVSMKEALASANYRNSTADLPIALGKTISNDVFVADLAKMPHLLMAGATGQGKSVGINTIIASILYKKHPDDVKFIMVDPKKVELSLFSLIKNHFLPELPDGQDAIITDTKMVVAVLKSLCMEMDERYNKLKDAQVRNIKEYNKKIEKGQLDHIEHERLPYIILVIDELADLMMTAGKEVEMPICRLAQLARAIGIHLIIATQRPSVNIITGTIKANFPARIAFKVTSVIDSRTILDTGGANQLIGNGDMLFTNGGDIIRLQCPFIDTQEVSDLTQFISEQPYPLPFKLRIVTEEEGEGSLDSFDGELDTMFGDAARMIVSTQTGSTSMLQRRLNLGYNRAGRVMDQLEKMGIVGPSEGSKVRKVLYSDEMALEQYLKTLGQ